MVLQVLAVHQDHRELQVHQVQVVHQVVQDLQE